MSWAGFSPLLAATLSNRLICSGVRKIVVRFILGLRYCSSWAKFRPQHPMLPIPSQTGLRRNGKHGMLRAKLCPRRTVPKAKYEAHHDFPDARTNQTVG